MLIQVIATVVFPVYLNQEIEMPENFTPDELREKILETADLALTLGSQPVITECESHPEIAE